ncbi:hypothetical protein MLGJGCBP_03381 [Rhodococcus sp. T7]|nr:hypothetical protein MLGJGCBP_03381 [Rhodococcus sp. T7]
MCSSPAPDPPDSPWPCPPTTTAPGCVSSIADPTSVRTRGRSSCNHAPSSSPSVRHRRGPCGARRPGTDAPAPTRSVPARPAGRLRLPGTAVPRFLLIRQGEVELFLRRALRPRGRGRMGHEPGTPSAPATTSWVSAPETAAPPGSAADSSSDATAPPALCAGRQESPGTVRRTPQKILLADIELDGDLHPGVAHTRSTAPVCCFCSPWVMWPRGGCSPHSLRTAHPPRANVAVCSSFSTRPSCPPMSPRWHGRSGFRYSTDSRPDIKAGRYFSPATPRTLAPRPAGKA